MESMAGMGSMTDHFAEMQARAEEIQARIAALSGTRQAPPSTAKVSSLTPDTRHPMPFSSCWQKSAAICNCVRWEPERGRSRPKSNRWQRSTRSKTILTRKWFAP